MASIVEVKKCSLTRGSATIDGESDSITDVYIVLLDEPPADFTEVVALLMADKELAIGDGYAGNPDDARRLKSFDVGKLETTTDYVVEVKFEVPDGSNGGATDPNPLMRPDEISITGNVSEKTYFKDYTTPDNKFARSSAGEPFENLPTRDVGSFEIPIRCNRATFDASLHASYLYPVCAINSDTVTIRGITFAPGQLKMRPFRAALPTYENGVKYYVIEMAVAVAENWNQTFQDRGYSYKDGSGKLQPIMLDNGKDKPSAPWPLDGSGGKKANATDAPADITLKPYPAKPFSVFGWTSSI